MSDPFDGVPTLELEIPKTLWLTSNHRLHHHAKAHATKWLRQLARQTAKARDPEYPATLYVTELAGPATVNTMPEKTMRATADADLDGITDTLTGRGEEAQRTMDAIAAAGVDLDDVFAVLEREGVEKFVDCWNELLESIDGRLSEIRG